MSSHFFDGRSAGGKSGLRLVILVADLFVVKYILLVYRTEIALDKAVVSKRLLYVWAPLVDR